VVLDRRTALNTAAMSSLKFECTRTFATGYNIGWPFGSVFVCGEMKENDVAVCAQLGVVEVLSFQISPKLK
jgi:hypothetical protein